MPECHAQLGRASWERWQQSAPLINSSEWRAETDQQTFADDISTIRERCHQWGYDMLKLFAPIMGGQKLSTEHSPDGLTRLEATDPDNLKRYVYLLNKSPKGSTTISLNSDQPTQTAKITEVMHFDSDRRWAVN